jgi:hypothetical protein
LYLATILSPRVWYSLHTDWIPNPDKPCIAARASVKSAGATLRRISSSSQFRYVLSRLFSLYSLHTAYSLVTMDAIRDDPRRRETDAGRDNPRVGDVPGGGRTLGTIQDHLVEASERWRDQSGSRWARRSHQSPFHRWLPRAGFGRFIGRREKHRKALRVDRSLANEFKGDMH